MKITIIGAGNVGTHLAKRLFECKHEIIQVFSRNREKAQELAKTVNASPIIELHHLKLNADLYILAVKDDAIEEVARQIPFRDKLVVHTSGAKSSEIFQPYFDHFGVFYPLQTFSINKEADFEKLPICVYANSKSSIQTLQSLANSICPNIYTIDDEQRATLHVCAVMVNNFTNFMYVMAEDILKQEQLSLDILRPLIEETVLKISKHPAEAMQTGPARRNDLQTIEQHLIFLRHYPDYQKLYQDLSASIVKFYKED